MAVEACGKLLQYEAFRGLSQGNWPWVVGPSAVPSCTGSQESMDSDLYLLPAWRPLWKPSHPPLWSQTAAWSHPPPLALTQAFVVAGWRL